MKWFCSRSDDHTGGPFTNFILAYGLGGLVTSSMQIPDKVDLPKSHYVTLKLYYCTSVLISHPDRYLVSVDVLLGSSDSCLIRSKVKVFDL